MKKNKFKVLGFASLALLMACTGTFVFAPLTTSAHEEPTTTTGLGLDPKNDPVVYTTESGLEIKMSNANKFSGSVTTTSNRGNKYSQDLSSFYYFTMGTFSGTIYTAKTQTDAYEVNNEPVNWIILGVGSHSNAFVESVSNYLFSAIKNHDYLFEDGEYFFDNQHETFSPAGSLIDSTVNTKTYLMGKVKDSIKVHTDIPKGCMLVLSEKLLGKMYFNSTGSINYAYDSSDYLVENMFIGNGYYGNRYRFYGETNAHTGTQSWNTTNNSGGSLFNYINNLFSKNNSTGAIEGDNKLGFTKAQADLIVPQQLYTIYYDGTSTYQENPSTDKGTYYSMFPLADNSSYASSIYQNFGILDYLDSDAKRVACLIGSSQSDYWWLRSGSNTICRYGRNVVPNGELYVDGYNVKNSLGVRPAMVMKLQ